nr:DUF4864 domain-containing protein [Mesorhizobium shangrilense]
MLRAVIILLVLFAPLFARAGEVEVQAAQTTIDSQIRAFLADDADRAYSFAAPNVQRLFPTVETFMGMVTGGYQPVYHPRDWSFGKVKEMDAVSIIQQVFTVGPDGKDYEAVYTLELQADGVWRITGVSLRAANSVSM